MNSDFIQSVIVKIIIAAGSAWAAKHAYSIDGSTLQIFAGSLAAAGAAGWRLYQGYATKKVPETSVAIQVTGAGAANVASVPVGVNVANVTGKVVG